MSRNLPDLLRDLRSHCGQSRVLTPWKVLHSHSGWRRLLVGLPPLLALRSARTKDGWDAPVSVNYDSEEYQEELKLSEPLHWDISREFPEDAEKAGMKKEMGSTREFQRVHGNSD